jgi:AAA family ATP:ADP antiporter
MVPESASLAPRRLLAWLGTIHFLILGSWYVLRPLRDEIATVDPRKIPWLWTAVFVVMLLASPLFGWAVARLPRRRFLGGTLGLFGLALALQAGLLRYGPDAWRGPLELCFYIFCSVYSLFVVSVFWSFASDLLRAGSAERLFGPVAACGTLGTIATSQVVSSFRESLSIEALVVLALLLLEGARQGMLRLDREVSQAGLLPGGGGALAAGAREQRVEGGVLEGIAVVFRSPYLLAIVACVSLTSLNGSIYYQLQSELLQDQIASREARGSFLADLNKYTSYFTLAGQLFLNAWLLERIGVGRTLLVQPLWAAIGLVGLGWAIHTNSPQVLVLYTLFDVGSRTIAHGLAKPTREYLFTLVPREQKYRAKNFIDTAVYRGADAAGAWAIQRVLVLGTALSQLSLLGLLPAAVWAGLTLALGRRAKQRRSAVDAAEAGPGVGA